MLRSKLFQHAPTMETCIGFDIGLLKKMFIKVSSGPTRVLTKSNTLERAIDQKCLEVSSQLDRKMLNITQKMGNLTPSKTIDHTLVLVSRYITQSAICDDHTYIYLIPSIRNFESVKPPHFLTLGRGITRYTKGVVGLWPRG